MCRSLHVAQALLFQPSSGNAVSRRTGFSSWYKRYLIGSAQIAQCTLPLLPTSHLQSYTRKLHKEVWAFCAGELHAHVPVCITTIATCLVDPRAHQQVDVLAGVSMQLCPCEGLKDLGLSKAPSEVSYKPVAAFHRSSTM